jgi:hypothetical protein
MTGTNTSANKTRKVSALGGLMPFETASFLNDLSNWALLAALVLGVIATAGVVYTSNIKERYFKHDLASTSERAAELERNDQYWVSEKFPMKNIIHR